MYKWIYFFCVLILGFLSGGYSYAKSVPEEIKVLKKQTIQKAGWALKQYPVTVTDFPAPRSAGGIHDFFSEGDYWWPDPENPDGPYIQRDGLSNPDNFTAHREAMIRFSQIAGSLVSAFLITGEKKYAEHAITHLKAWFIDSATSMNPSLLYAQAIKGRATGRSIGIIDMIQMLDVAQAVLVLEKKQSIDPLVLAGIKNWFSKYLHWVTSHEYGIKERDAKNNHGTCWVMQVAAFARLTGNDSLLEDCSRRYLQILLPDQMDGEGKFPLEINRTKPYSYSIFNLDALATICTILSTKEHNFFTKNLSDGRGIKKGIDFMFPFIKNKTIWPYPKDVMYWDELPVAPTFLILGYEGFKNANWFNTWKELNHFPIVGEVVRNQPVRYPLLWIDKING